MTPWWADIGDDTLEGGAGADELDGGKSGADGILRIPKRTPCPMPVRTLAVTVDLASSTASGGHAQGDEIETYEFDDMGTR